MYLRFLLKAVNISSVPPQVRQCLIYKKKELFEKYLIRASDVFPTLCVPRSVHTFILNFRIMFGVVFAGHINPLFGIDASSVERAPLT